MADVIFGVALVFVLLAIHPYTFYPLSLALMKRRPIKTAPADWRRPTVAICMSAYNEERVIEAKIESLLAMVAHYGPATIHVYVDGSSDRTAQLLQPYADRIRLVISDERRGKTAGMKQLVAGVDSEIIAFTDANVVVPADALTNLAGALSDPEVCCASARLLYSNRAETGVSASGAIYWNIEEFIKSLEAETVGLVGVDGALFLIKREAYSAPPDELIDDLYVSVCALLTGKRVVSAQSVMVEERGAVRMSEEFVRKARISCQAMRVHKALWPQLRRASPLILYCYLSHRFLKWMTPFSLLAAGICILIGLGLVFGPMTPLVLTIVGLLVLAVGGWLNLPVIRVAVGAIVSLSGVAYGQLQALFTDETYSTWTPAATVRDEV